MHYHIFIAKNTIAFTDSLYQELKSHPEIDVLCLVREYLANHIVAKAGIDADIAELDYSNIVWSKDSRGSMIRIEGCQRQFNLQGKWFKTYKTVVGEIPHQKPDPENFFLPLKFPEMIELWNISYLQNEIIELLKSEIERHERNQALMQIQRLKRLITPHISSRRKCLGFQRAENGVIEGIRDEVATGLICACKKWTKIDHEQCREFMYRWAGSCSPGFEPEIIDYKIGRIYGMQQCYNPCGFFVKAGLCEKSNCSIMQNKGSA